ncbi:MAG: hypothetical protein IKJ52_04095 [Muribaculaceae bacterium]|nr:hypothetical protein [Muribaculaceae bacterium]
MKSLDIEELKRDCLNPKDENGEPLMDNNGKPLSFASEEELKKHIVKITREMCQKRKDNISLVEKDYDEMKEVLPELRKSLEKVKEKANIYKASSVEDKNLDNSTCDKILELCESICLTLNDYEKNIETMYNRFKNGTIRISSVGAAGSGKSTFARYYTGLVDEIPTHKQLNTETTGTVCINICTNSNEVKYIATYYTKQDILETLNYYLDEIRRYNPGFRLFGIEKFEDFEKDFVSNIGKFERDRMPDIGRLTTPIGNGLETFFKQYDSIRGGYWYNFLGKEESELKSSAEQQQHILMTDPTSLYLAVKEVKTYIKFKKNADIFENFEIVDTKGIGSAAGAHAIREVCSAIDSSDAVFSIQPIQTDTNYPFYNNEFLLSKYGGDKMFKKKHFMILNLYSGANCETALKTLKINGLSGEFAYCGSLYDKECHRDGCVKPEHTDNLSCILTCSTNEQCRKFVDLVVRNMLLRVSTMISELDNDRIKKRLDDKKIIAKKLKDLLVLIGDNSYTYKGPDDVLLNIIRGFVVDTSSYITANIVGLEKEKDHNKSYIEYLEDNNKITLYDIITGKSSEKSQKIDKNDEESTIKNEIKSALDSSYKELFNYFTSDKNHLMGEHIGRYIEDFASCLHDRLISALISLSKQQELEPEVRKDISSKIWKLFRLDKINGPGSEENWEKYKGENEFFKELYEIFNPILSNYTEFPKLYELYELLRGYFLDNDCESELEDDYEDKEGNICIKAEINETRLKEVATNLIYKSKVHETIADIYNSHSVKKQREELLKKIDKRIKGDDIIATRCLDFYRKYSDIILTEEEQSKIKLADTWSELSSIKGDINTVIRKFDEN